VSEHTDVAAYSLGLLESDDRVEFEAHLAECELCTAELAEFAAMAGLFTGVEPVESGPAEPDEASVASLLSRRGLARRRQARQRLTLAAAACVVLLGGGVAAGIAAAPQQAVLALNGQLHSATNARTGVTGTVGLVSKPFGTLVTLELSHVRGPLECQLVAVSKTGERRIVVGWQVPPTGYGVPGHPADLLIPGATSIMAQDLARIEVDVVHGGTLVTIPV
jgi:hypothetical protein